MPLKKDKKGITKPRFQGLECEGDNVLPTKFEEDKFRSSYGKIMNIKKLDEVISSINGWCMKYGLFGLNGTSVGSTVFWKDNSFVGFGGEAQPQLKGNHRFLSKMPGVGSRLEMLKELAQREKQAEIFPEAEVDFFIKATAVEGDASSLITYYTLKVHAIERTSSISELNDNDDVGEMLEISKTIRDYHDSIGFPQCVRRIVIWTLYD
nr:ABC transporter G family member 35-like isoform X3 [Tanacetum cinerariifolium]